MAEPLPSHGKQTAYAATADKIKIRSRAFLPCCGRFSTSDIGSDTRGARLHPSSRSSDLRILNRLPRLLSCPMTGFRLLQRPPRLQRRYRPGFSPGFLFSRAARTAARTLDSFTFSYRTMFRSLCQGKSASFLPCAVFSRPCRSFSCLFGPCPVIYYEKHRVQPRIRCVKAAGDAFSERSLAERLPNF